MTMLQAPDGTRYETDNDAEVRNLTLGHGYQVVADDPNTGLPATASGPADAPEGKPADGPETTRATDPAADAS